MKNYFETKSGDMGFSIYFLTNIFTGSNMVNFGPSGTSSKYISLTFESGIINSGDFTIGGYQANSEVLINGNIVDEKLTLFYESLPVFCNDWNGANQVGYVELTGASGASIEYKVYSLSEE